MRKRGYFSFHFQVTVQSLREVRLELRQEPEAETKEGPCLWSHSPAHAQLVFFSVPKDGVTHSGLGPPPQSSVKTVSHQLAIGHSDSSF